MKIPLTYGFLSALGGAVLTLLLYFTGFHDSIEKLPAAQWIGGIAGLAIFITCVSLAMRDKRSRTPAGTEWGYGSAFGVGVLTSLVNAILGSIFVYVYFAIINPQMPDLIFAMQQAKMEEKGISSTQIANAEPMMRKMMSPGVTACFQAIFGFIVSVVITLIVAIFFRQPSTTALDGEMPPPIA